MTNQVVDKNEDRDVEKEYSVSETVAKLRRLADSLENGTPFRIQISGERVNIPVRAVFNIEHERSIEDGEEEVEFQFKWKIED